MVLTTFGKGVRPGRLEFRYIDIRDGTSARTIMQLFEIVLTLQLAAIDASDGSLIEPLNIPPRDKRSKDLSTPTTIAEEPRRV